MYFILGNHDLYYREKRELNSIEFARDLDNFVMLDEHFVKDDVAIALVSRRRIQKVQKMDVKYMFGHFELILL